jgi:hypothetical protein
MRDKLICAPSIDTITAATQKAIDSDPETKVVAVWPEPSPYTQ